MARHQRASKIITSFQLQLEKIVLSVSKCFDEEGNWSNLIKEGSNELLFEVTGYPQTGDIPLLNRKGSIAKWQIRNFYEFVMSDIKLILLKLGTRVNVREHPYVVSIRRNGAHYLTGTLITKNIVLTAAHPLAHVPIQELRVVAGETYSDRGTALLTVVIVLIHEDYDPFTLAADIAMLRFYEDVVFRSSVKSISLVMPQKPLSGTAFVTGWGRCDSSGSELCLPRTSQYYPDEKIDPMLRSISLSITSQNYYCEGYKRHETNIREGMLCAGNAREENSVSACLGVPGAPLVVNGKLAAILSWGFGCGYLHDLPLVYTSTQHYTRWIARNIDIFRRLTKNDFSKLFEATKSYVILDWLSRTRVSTPVRHDHGNTNRELRLTELDEQLAKLHGIPFDIRDGMCNVDLHEKKLSLYEDLRKAIVDNITKTEIIRNASKLILMHKPRSFLSNESLMDIDVSHEDYENSDDD